MYSEALNKEGFQILYKHQVPISKHDCLPFRYMIAIKLLFKITLKEKKTCSVVRLNANI